MSFFHTIKRVVPVEPGTLSYGVLGWKSPAARNCHQLLHHQPTRVSRSSQRSAWFASTGCGGSAHNPKNSTDALISNWKSLVLTVKAHVPTDLHSSNAMNSSVKSKAVKEFVWLNKFTSGVEVLEIGWGDRQSEPLPYQFHISFVLVLYYFEHKIIFKTEDKSMIKKYQNNTNLMWIFCELLALDMSGLSIQNTVQKTFKELFFEFLHDWRTL
jgi:hypothetical protein